MQQKCYLVFFKEKNAKHQAVQKGLKLELGKKTI